MKKAHILGVIVVILTIISLTQGIFGVTPIGQWKIWDSKAPQASNEPFNFILEPPFISQGLNSNGVPVVITISNLRKANFSSIQLLQGNVQVDRKNKTSQTKIAPIYWNDVRSGESVFYYGDSFIPDKLTKGGILGYRNCEDCFRGVHSPYIFTFVIHYTKNGIKDTITLKREIPIT